MREVERVRSSSMDCLTRRWSFFHASLNIDLTNCGADQTLLAVKVTCWRKLHLHAHIYSYKCIYNWRSTVAKTIFGQASPGECVDVFPTEETYSLINAAAKLLTDFYRESLFQDRIILGGELLSGGLALPAERATEIRKKNLFIFLINF